MFDATARRPKGYAIWTGPDAPPVERDTAQCKHCQMHWFIEPGSGRARGFCLRCMGPTCGKPACEARCVPFFKKLDAMESRARFAEAAGLVTK